MSWFNRNNKEKVSRDQLAGILYHFSKKFSADYVSHEISKEDSPFKEADEDVFTHERLIMIFWVIDKFFSDKERKLMALIHKHYFVDSGLINDKESAKEEMALIIRRYGEYHEAHNANAGVEQYLLGGVIARNILQKERSEMNLLITSEIAMDITLLIKEIKESIFDKFEIIDQ